MTVLGLVWLRGPRKPYAIMKELSLSPSSYHKSRAGATYSVVRRLVGFGLLTHDTLLSVTPAGEEAIRAWLAIPLPEADIAHSSDFVRLRTYFLGAVSDEERLEFIDSCLSSVKDLLPNWVWAMENHEKHGEYYGVLGAAGVLLETRARIQWLEMYREFLVSPIKSDWTATVRKHLDL